MNRKKHVLTIVVLVAVIIVTLVALSSCDLFGDSQEEEKDLKVELYSVSQSSDFAVDNEKKTVDFAVSVTSEKFSLSRISFRNNSEIVFKAYYDKALTKEIDKEVTLSVGENVFYIQAWHKDAPSEKVTYTVTVTKPVAHVHAFGQWTVVTEATCTENGLQERVCECGEKESEVVEAKGHTFGEWTTTVEPTCADGEKKRVCSDCGHVEKEVIEAVSEHTFGEWTVETSATCTEKGQEKRTCDSCGEEEFRSIDALGHDYDEGQVTTEATCTEDGVKTFTCQRDGCGDTYTEVIPAKGHTFGEWEVTVEPTCADGERQRGCSDCGYVETEVIEAVSEHTFGVWVTTIEPTCADGEKERICSVCGRVEKEVIPAIGEHTYGEWIVVTAATCEEKGQEKRTCEVCGEEETRTTLPLGHDYDEGVVTKYATCTEDGRKTYTCLRDGCEYSYDVVIPAKGHSFGEWITKKEPTCADGEKQRVCTVCYHTESATIPATEEHNFVNGVCTVCGTEFYGFADKVSDDFVSEKVTAEEWEKAFDRILYVKAKEANYSIDYFIALPPEEDVMGLGGERIYRFGSGKILIDTPLVSNQYFDITQTGSDESVVSFIAGNTAVYPGDVFDLLSMLNVTYSDVTYDEDIGGYVYSGSGAPMIFKFKNGALAYFSSMEDQFGYKFYVYGYGVTEVTPPEPEEPTNPPEETVTFGSFELLYKDNAYIITGYNGYASTVIVPSSYNGYPIETIAYNAFRGGRDIKEIIVSDGIKVIEDEAFGACDKLYRIYLPASLTEVGKNAFQNLYKLVQIKNQSDVTVTSFAQECEIISDGEFQSTVTTDENGVVIFEYDGVRYLLGYDKRSVELDLTGYDIDKVFSYAFASYMSDYFEFRIILPEGLTSIGKYAFRNSDLSEITLPSSLTEISDGAFSYTYLVSIDLPTSVTSIGEKTFYYAYDLTEVTGGEGLIYIGKDAFAETPLYNNASGAVYIGSVLYSYKGETETLTVKAGTLGIADYALSGNVSLRNLELPEGVVYIGKSAFADCRNLVRANLPASLDEIGFDAFEGCYKLVQIKNLSAISVKSPASRSEIISSGDFTSEFYVDEKGVELFSYEDVLYMVGYRGTEGTLDLTGYGIKEVFDYACSDRSFYGLIFPDGVERIGSQAFQWAGNIYIPLSVVEFGDGYLFDFMGDLLVIRYEGTRAQWTNIVNSNQLFAGYKYYFEGEVYEEEILVGDEVTEEGWNEAVARLSGKPQELNFTVKTEMIDGDLSQYKELLGEELVMYSVLKADNGRIISTDNMEAFWPDWYSYSEYIPERDVWIGSGGNETPAEEYELGDMASGMFAVFGYSAFTYDPTTGSYNILYSEGANVSKITVVIKDGYLCYINLYSFDGENTYKYKSIYSDYGTTVVAKQDVKNNEGLPSAEDDNFVYTEVEGGWEVTSYKMPSVQSESDTFRVVIPSSFQGKPVIGVSADMFDYNSDKIDKITEVVFPESIIYVSDTNYVINSVKETAWYKNLPNGPVYIGKVLFSYKDDGNGVTSLIIKDGTLSILEKAFKDITTLESVVIADSVKIIGDDAFRGCFNLTSVTLPSALTRIGTSAFAYCGRLTEISIPETVEFVGSYAFFGCVALDTIDFGGTAERWSGINFLEGVYGQQIFYNVI